jgi:hypothetical protein
MSIIFKCQKCFKCKKIFYQKTRNKDDNDTEKCNTNMFIHFQNLIQNFRTSIFALLQISFISMVGFSICISSHNPIIANFSRCVRDRPDRCFPKLILLFILNFKVKSDIQLTFYVAQLITIKKLVAHTNMTTL